MENGLFGKNSVSRETGAVTAGSERCFVCLGMVVEALGLVLQPGQRQNCLEGAARPRHLLASNCCCQSKGLILSAHENESKGNVF